MEAIPLYRKCKKCGELLPITEFWHNDHCRGGREPTCKRCKTAPKPTSSRDISLADLSDEALINELRRRGFVGDLRQNVTISI